MNIPHAETVTKHPKSQQRHTNPQQEKPGTNILHKAATTPKW
jgi:hypothetical protein